MQTVLCLMVRRLTCPILANWMDPCTAARGANGHLRRSVQAATCVDRLVKNDAEERELAWMGALVLYGRCFGKGVRPWGAADVVGSLPKVFQVRHRHFRRLRDTLVSHPGGIRRTFRAEGIRDRDGALHVKCEEVPMFSLGHLEAMDFAELLSALQALVERRRVEVTNDLRLDLVEMSAEQFRELPVPACVQPTHRGSVSG